MCAAYVTACRHTPVERTVKLSMALAGRRASTVPSRAVGDPPPVVPAGRGGLNPGTALAAHNRWLRLDTPYGTVLERTLPERVLLQR